MKTIGLIGGMTWESSLEYYRIINQEVNRQLGSSHSAKLVLISVDMDEIEKLQDVGNWDGLAKVLVEAIHRSKAAGAELFVLCSNTVHKVANKIEKTAGIQLINLLDALAKQIKASGHIRVGLLGTKYSMEDGFYQERLKTFGIDVITPDDKQRTRLNDYIFSPQLFGEKQTEASDYISELIADLNSKGTEAVILGCTELGLLVDQGNSDIPLFDTLAIHANEAIQQALA